MIVAGDKHSVKTAVKILHRGRKRKLARARAPDYTKTIEREYRNELWQLINVIREGVRRIVLPSLGHALQANPVRQDISVGSNKAAANAALYALRTGKIKKTPCETCGERHVIAHHHDYRKPLKVSWLCNSCHRKLHWEQDGNNASLNRANIHVNVDAKNSRMDAVDDAIRSIGEVKLLIARTVDVTREVRTVGSKIEGAQKKTLTQQFERVLNIRPELHEPYLASMMDGFARTNTRLVGQVSEQFLGSLEDRISDGARQGLRAEDLATQIEQDFVDIDGLSVQAARKRATLIARDQVASFRSDVEKVRQSKLGITQFVWRTSQDERVRKTHAEREGITFSWEGDFKKQLEEKGLTPDPIDGPPGRPINCRCTSEPVLEDLLGDD